MKFRRIGSAVAALLCLSFASAKLFSEGQTARFALVIGNGNYGELGRLANPANDATDMAALLRKLGFDTQLLVDADLRSMEDGLVKLGSRLASSPSSTGFFYYAGHGVQSGGTNYLIPSDARIPGETFLKARALAAQTVLETLDAAKNGLNVIVLDACRDNPFGWSRSGARGLSVVGNQPTGSIIVYATSAGGVAEDGRGRNGAFTEELLKHLATPGLEIKEVFNRTGAAVRDATGGRQVPAVYSQFFDSAWLASPPTGTAGEGGAAPKPAVSSGSRAPGKLSELMVRTSEDGATIYVDGKPRGRSPLLVSSLASGVSHLVEARGAQSFASIEISLVPGELRDITIVMTSPRGNLVISSDEKSVRVVIDGVDRGELGSGVLRDVPAGARRLELVGQDLYYATSVTVPANATAQVQARVRAVGSLEFRIPDDASVMVRNLGDTWLQNGPGVLANLPVGTYLLVAANRNDWIPATGTLTLAKGQRAVWEPWKDGSLAFSVNPAGATCVLEGGRELSTSRPGLGMPAGNYQAILHKPGYRDQEVSFTVAIGRLTRISASLERLRPGMVKVPPVTGNLFLRVAGWPFWPQVEPDGTLRFEGIPSGYPIDLTLESPLAISSSIPLITVNLAENETARLEVPTGQLALPWIAKDATVAIGGVLFPATGGGPWTSPSLPLGSYLLEIGGQVPWSAPVEVRADTLSEPPDYRSGLGRALAEKRRSAEKTLADRPGAILGGWTSFAVGVLGMAGAGASWYYSDQALSLSHAAPDAASAASLSSKAEVFAYLFYASAALGSLGLGGSWIFFQTIPDPAVLERSIETLDAGITALGFRGAL